MVTKAKEKDWVYTKKRKTSLPKARKVIHEIITLGEKEYYRKHPR